jgi:uncharacterized protein YkwD
MDRPSLISTNTCTSATRTTATRRVRTTVLLAAAMAVLALVGVSCTKNAQAFDSAARVNDTRTRMGLRALAIDDTLVNKAQAWAEHMARAGSISHSRLSDGAGNDWAVLGENVGVAGSTAQMHSLFMNSPAHRDNIVSGSYNRIGTGVAEAGGKLYVVQVFAG